MELKEDCIAVYRKGVIRQEFGVKNFLKKPKDLLKRSDRIAAVGKFLAGQLLVNEYPAHKEVKK